MKSKLLLCILSSLPAILVYGQSAGDYRSKQSGNWNNGANWERFTGVSWQAADAVPSSADGAITISGGHDITVNVTTIADQLIVDAGGSLIMTAHLILNDGNGDDLTINGTLNFISSILYGPGNAVVAAGGTLNLSSGNLRWFGAHTTNNGTMNWHDGTTYFYNSTVLTNAGTFNITGNNGMTNENNASGIFVNSGTMNKTSSGISRFSITTVNNSGTINLDAGTLENQTNFTNTGILNFNSGDFIHELNRVFNHNNGSNFTGTGGFTNNGTMNLNINQSFPSSVELAVGSSSIITGPGNLTINNDFSMQGEISGTGSFTVNADITWIGGSLKRPLTVRAVDSFTFATPAAKLIYVPIINNGTMDWQNGTIYFKTNGVLLTNAGTFNITGNNSLLNEIGTSGTFVNNGTITKTSTGLTDFQSTAVNNTGTINLNGSGGTLRKQPNPYATTAADNMFTNTGQLNFNGGAFINALNNAFNHNTGSTIGGTGNFTNNGTMYLNINQTFPSTLVFAVGSSSLTTGPGNLTINNNFIMQIAAFEPGSIIDGTGSLTINANITWNGGMFKRPFTIGSPYNLNFATESEKRIAAAITNSGTMNWNGGTIRFSASVTLINAGNFNINGNHSMVNENFVTGAFVNAGLMTKTSTGTSSFPISTFTNNSIAIINGSGTFDINATFNNNGTIAPGLSPGILTMNNRQPFSINSTLSIEIAGNGGAGQPTGHDQLQRNGDLTLAGTLTVLETGTVPNGSYTIISLTSGTISGSFATTNLPAGYTLSQTSTTVVLTKQVAPSNYRSKQTGNWNLASTWERFDGVNWVDAITSPSSSDGIISIINTHQVTVTDARSADQLIVDADATLTVSGGAGILTLDNGDGIDLSVNGQLNLSGTLIGNGSAQLNGSMNWTGGIVSVDLTITSTGTLTMSTSNTKTLQSKNIINHGTINWNDGNFNFSSAGLQNENIFNQTVDRAFNSLGVLDVFLNTVSGTFTKSAVGNSNIDVGVTNRGTFKGTGTLSFNAAFTNTGIIAPGLSPGILTANGSAPFSSNSTLSIEIMNANGAGTGHDQLQRAGNLTLEGTLTVVETGIVPAGTYTIISLTSGTISGSFTTTNLPAGYTLTQTSTTVIVTKQFIATVGDYRSKQTGAWDAAASWERFNGMTWVAAVSTPSHADGVITIRSGHTITVINSLIINNSVTADQLIVQTSAILTLAEGSLKLNNGPGEDLTVHGTMNLNTSTLDGLVEGALTHAIVSATGILNFGTTSENYIGVPITNYGTINWQDGDIRFIDDVTLTNEGNFNITGSDRIAPENFPLDGILVNNGTMTKSSAGITGFYLDKVFNNGIFNVGGLLEIFTYHFNNAGVLNLNDATIASNFIGLNPSAVFDFNAGSVISGSGYFFNYGTMNVNTALEFPSTVALIFRLGEITGPGSLTTNGDFIFDRYGSTIIPTLDLAGGLTTNGNGTWVNGLINLGGDITNNGTMEWQHTHILFTGDLTFTNTGNFNISGNVNMGGGPEWQTAFLNDGTMTKSSTGTSGFGVNIFTNSNGGIITGLGTFGTGPINNNGTISPGLSPGILTFNSSTMWALSANSKLNIEIKDGTGPGAGHDQLKRAGDLILNGTLNVTEIGNVPDGDYIIISLTSGIISGTFASTNLPANYAVVYNSNNVILRKGIISCPSSVTISANPGITICAGINVTFAATPTNGGAIPSYQWKLNGNNVGTNSNTYSTNALANGDQVSCEMTSSLACASPVTPTSNIITMTVNPSVTPSVIITANPGNTICAGTTVTFTATSTNGGATPTYQWKLNGSDVGTNSSSYSNDALSNDDQVSCVITSSVACTTPTSATSNNLAMVVTAAGLPSVSISANPGDTICAGTSVTFTATALNGGANPSYQWKLNGADVGTNSNSYTNETLVSGDEVSCVMISSQACVDPSAATSNSIIISITPGAVIATIASIGNRNECPRTLQANPGGPVSYQWYKEGIEINGATERRYVANTNGSYSVRVTRNGCSDMSSAIVITSCPSIQTKVYTNSEFMREGRPLIPQNRIHLYPNPASEYVTIELQQNENVNGEATVQLVTLYGRVLLTQKLQVLKGKINGKLKLNSVWTDELYLVKVIVNNKIYVGKLIKIKP